MSHTSILVTRPMPEAVRVSERITDLGYHTIVAPLQTVEAVPWNWPEQSYYQALMVTSANAARQISPHNIPKHLLNRPAFAVGDHTAAVLRTMGWQDIRSAAGTGFELAKLVMKICPVGGGPLLHIAGSQLAEEPHATLDRAGYKIDLRTVYKMDAAASLPLILKESLEKNLIRAWPCFSPQGAVIFTQLITAAGLQDSCKNIIALTLSQNIADKHASLPWQKVVVAKEPNENAVLAALQEACPL